MKNILIRMTTNYMILINKGDSCPTEIITKRKFNIMAQARPLSVVGPPPVGRGYYKWLGPWYKRVKFIKKRIFI